MAVKAGDLETELIDAVCERLREQLPEPEAVAAESFVRQYYHWVPPEDLAQRSAEDLYAAAFAHWQLAGERAPGQTRMRVFNPTVQRDGFESPHTLIQIVSDDMPFVVDTVTMELVRYGYGINLVIHPVIAVERDGHGVLVGVPPPGSHSAGARAESMLHAEVVPEHDEARLVQLQGHLERVLEQVRAAVEDWQAMRERVLQLTAELDPSIPRIGHEEVEEVRAFLEWVAEDHFTFLGYREYDLVEEDGELGLRVKAGSGLGILRGEPPLAYKRLRAKAAALAQTPHPLVLTKANSRSPVHRPSYLDYIGVKRLDPDGHVIGECRFLGLYTTAAYRMSPREIPMLRGKVGEVLLRAGFPPASHDSKALVEIVESYPRDALFQIGIEDLFTIAMGLMGLGERQRVKLFAWPDPLDRFISCVVTIPRDRFNTENRERVGRILLEAFDGSQLDWTLQLSESLLVRVNYIVHCERGVPEDLDLQEVETRLSEATRAWSDDLRSALLVELGEEQGGILHRRYEHAFPPGYTSDWSASSAVRDIEAIERLEQEGGTILDLYRPSEGPKGLLRCKLYSSTGVALSDVVPTFEHMGARVIDERPYEVSRAGRGLDGEEPSRVWIYDFGLGCVAEDIEEVSGAFEEVFLGARRGVYEDDGLNGLVLAAGLNGSEIVVLRSAARYLRQAGIPYSDAYMERTLLGHPDIAHLLVRLFRARFDPDQTEPELAERLARAMELAIDSVRSLDEDRILRSFLAVARAMLRTSYFRVDAEGAPLPYLAFKLDPAKLELLPRPRPQFEIFVYSPRFEGVHMRAGRVARGGLRWSDRPEDFRTEILGLAKAQMVKNALIVPVGAKGGFVLKRNRGEAGEKLREEAVACYRLFLAGLLDLTDNLVDGRVLAPERVVRYDADDTYLVVAADKGTAAFSDIANEISARYSFWLGDAFASGGSHGYDHKQMGITARGAWESVKRHFRELGTDIEGAAFTVVGIGDMSGDVFGNGMLLSRQIKLVAAFNHMHVFIDPDPDPEASFAERRRLFELPGSQWSDYDTAAISAGGGVYERSVKSIKLSAQARAALAIDARQLAPEDLIKAILRAPVDLLWNGGIGTYVKAGEESNADVGDKADDAVRVNGRELRCQVVGEGGNLGFTQRGRIEYALTGGPQSSGGRINTDSIDNVAGVNCSDHEVNIKILLDALVDRGELSEQDRNDLLMEMTDAVADQVLYGSYTQTQAISISLAQAESMVDVHGRLIRRLEQVAGLDRELEFLPSEDSISQRKAAHRGLVAPELAIVMAYCKIHLNGRLLDSDLPEDPYLRHDLERYFPAPLPVRYREQMHSHQLRREIIATVVANQLVDRAGTTFAFRLGEETGASPALLARAYAVAREVFGMRQFWEALERLDYEIDSSAQLQMLIEGRRLVERASRWLVHDEPERIDIAQSIERFSAGAASLSAALPEVLDEGEAEHFAERLEEFEGAGAPRELAARVAAMPSLVAVFDIVAVAEATGRTFAEVMNTYFRLGSRLELNWLRDRIIELPRDDRWQALARAALREDLLGIHRELTREVLEAASAGADSDAAIDSWAAQVGPALERCLQTIAEIRASRTYDTTTLPVALREVRTLIRGADSSAQL